jgi:chemotaxis protein MotB
MKPRLILSGLVVLAIPFFSSCVSSKKYKSAVAQSEELSTKNNELTTKNNELTQKSEALNQQVSQLSSANQKLTTEYKQYAATCEQDKARLQMLQTALHEESANMMKVSEKLNEALAKFHDKGVDIYTKDGLLYVSLQENLLYKSGSAKLGDDGKAALGSLASVLNEDFPKLKVIVLGNTDDVKSKKGSDNWSLSTERANGVVRTLRDDYKVDPTRLTAAGKGKYNPIADNSTADGRAKNRRTDIILNPDMERIWKSVEKQ